MPSASAREAPNERNGAHSAAVAGRSLASLVLPMESNCLCSANVSRDRTGRLTKIEMRLSEHAECIGKGEARFQPRCPGCRGIGNAPMRGHRLAGPHRTCLGRRVVADREDEIERRGVGPGELGPALGAQATDVEVQLAQQVEGVGMDAALRLAARREGAKIPASVTVQDGLRHDRARRISCAEKEDVERFSVERSGHGLCRALVGIGCGGGARGLAGQSLQTAKLRVPVTTIVDQKRDQCPHSVDIGAIDDRTTVSRAPDQSRARQNAEMARERIVRTADGLRNDASRQAAWLTTHQEPKYLEPGRLTEGSESRQCVRGRYLVTARHRTDVPDHRQRAFSHQPRPHDNRPLIMVAHFEMSRH